MAQVPNRFENRLLTWCIIGVSSIAIIWAISSLRYLFGINPSSAGDNFGFNIFMFYPINIIALIILYFTGGLAITERKRFKNYKKKYIIIIFSYGIIIYVGYTFIMLLRHLHI